MESIAGSVKHALSNLPVGSETAVKTVEKVEEKVKEVVSHIPVVGQSEKVKQFMGIHDEHQQKQQEVPHEEMTQKMQQARITPIQETSETGEQRPQTIGERLKPVIPTTVLGVLPTSVTNMLGMGTDTGTRAGTPTTMGTGTDTGKITEQKQPSYMDKISNQFDYFATEIKEKQNGRVYARALLKGRGNIIGDLTFGSDLNSGETCLVGSVMGLPPGEHAINIHEYGDLSQGHASIGNHFNPFHAQKHGGPTDRERHLGDVGNITAGPDGNAQVDLKDLDLCLVGPYSIIGRAIEIHAAGDAEKVPACDCPSGCECRINGGSHCPRSHKCAMCEAMKKIGEPIAIGVIVHCPEMKKQPAVKTEAFTKPWETLRGTSD